MAAMFSSFCLETERSIWMNMPDHRYADALIPHDRHEGESDSSIICSRRKSLLGQMRALHLPSLQWRAICGGISSYRSAKEIKGNMLTSGNIVVVGAKTSNPWAELYDRQLNFRLIEEGLKGGRYTETCPTTWRATFLFADGPDRSLWRRLRHNYPWFRV